VQTSEGLVNSQKTFVDADRAAVAIDEFDANQAAAALFAAHAARVVHQTRRNCWAATAKKCERSFQSIGAEPHRRRYAS